jgi:hypothetical protein
LISSCSITDADDEQMARAVQEKRLQEVLQYETLLTGVEQWLITVKASFSTDIQPTSPQAVKDQLLAYEVGILKCDSVFVSKNFKLIYNIYIYIILPVVNIF